MTNQRTVENPEGAGFKTPEEIVVHPQTRRLILALQCALGLAVFVLVFVAIGIAGRVDRQTERSNDLKAQVDKAVAQFTAFQEEQRVWRKEVSVDLAFEATEVARAIKDTEFALMRIHNTADNAMFNTLEAQTCLLRASLDRLLTRSALMRRLARDNQPPVDKTRPVIQVPRPHPTK